MTVNTDVNIYSGMDASLETLIEKHAGHQTNAARSVGVPHQVFHNWMTRGISREGRLLTWLALNSPRTLKRFLAEQKA